MSDGKGECSEKRKRKKNGGMKVDRRDMKKKKGYERERENMRESKKSDE